MQQFLSSFTNYTNLLGQKCSRTCLCLLFCSPGCEFECYQILLFPPVGLSSYPTLHLWAYQHYQYLPTLLFIPRNSIHQWPGLEHLMEMCGWLHRCHLPAVGFLCSDNHKSNYLMFILQTTGYTHQGTHPVSMHSQLTLSLTKAFHAYSLSADP